MKVEEKESVDVQSLDRIIWEQISDIREATKELLKKIKDEDSDILFTMDPFSALANLSRALSSLVKEIRENHKSEKESKKQNIDLRGILSE